MEILWRETPTDIIEYVARFVDDIDERRAMGGRPRKLPRPLPDINFPKCHTEMWFRDDGSWFAVICINELGIHNRKWVDFKVLENITS
jgi:hypothetical protein